MPRGTKANPDRWKWLENFHLPELSDLNCLRAHGSFSLRPSKGEAVSADPDEPPRDEYAPVVGWRGKMGQWRSVAQKHCRIPPHKRTACSIGFTKCFLAILNFAFLICGCILILIGLLIHVDKDSSLYRDLLHRVPTSGPLLVGDQLSSTFLLVGLCVAVLSFLGCCGACADSACFLCLYMLLLVVLLFAEIIVGISVSAYSSQISRSLQSTLLHQIRYEYNKTGRPMNLSLDQAKFDHVTSTWDIMQTRLNCCGAIGPRDYKYSVWFNKSNELEVPQEMRPAVPESCCNLRNRRPLSESTGLSAAIEMGDERVVYPDDKCQIDAILYPDLKDIRVTPLKVEGCQKMITDWVDENLSSIGCIIFLAICIQVVDFTFACMLMRWLRERHSNCHWSDEYG